MLSKTIKIIGIVAALMINTSYAAGDQFNVCWSHYTGWEPWAYANDSGILKKWGDKYNIDIKITLVNDYIESINLYTAGQYDA